MIIYEQTGLRILIVAVQVFLLCANSLAATIIGRTKLSLPGKNQEVLIEDISPDHGAKAQNAASHYATPWGVSLAVSRSGRQFAQSPATGWVTSNGPLFVDHVGTVDEDGRLLVFYWSPADEARSDRTESAAWKYVDVSEKTQIRTVVDQPTSWQIESNGLVQERLAAVDNKGDIRVFSWAPGHDWTASRVDHIGNTARISPLTGWAHGASGNSVENIAVRGVNGTLLHYARKGGGAWKKIDVSAVTKQFITSDPQGWRNSGGQDRIAASGASQHLWLFTSGSQSNWYAQDLSKSIGGQAIIGAVAAWERRGTQRLAARSPNGDLLVLKEDPIESQWSVENVSRTTGVKVSAAPVHWATINGSRTVTHIAAPDDQGHIRIFWREDDGPWKVVDVTAITNIGTPHRLTAWTTMREGGGLIEHLAAPTSKGYLHVFSWMPGTNWSAVDVTTRAEGRVVYVATPWAGVFVSRDYGVHWAQSIQPQPATTDTTVPYSLPVPRVLDVAVSPADPDLVFAAADREGRGIANARVTSAAGLYRSDDGGRTWSLAYQFTCGGRNNGVTQIGFSPDDPERVYAAGHCGIARSEHNGKKWTLLAPPGAGPLYHFAVSSEQVGRTNKRVLVACGPNDMWLSRDDGNAGSWISTGTSNLPVAFCGKTDFQYLNDSAAKVLAMDPENPERVFYAHHSLANGPSYYHPSQLGPEGVSCNIPVIYDVNDDGVVDGGDTWIRLDRQRPTNGSALGNDRKLKFVDADASGNWTAGEAVYHDTDDDGTIDDKEPRISGNAYPLGTTIKHDKAIRYLAGGYAGFDPGFGARQCGEGSLWLGDFSKTTSSSPVADWTQLPGPPVHYISYGTGSGSTMVQTVATAEGHLVLFTDADTLHVAKGPPVAGGWHRLDGISAGEVYSAGLSKANIAVHADPRGLDVSDDFDLDLVASSQPSPYHLSSDLKRCKGGRVWLSTDGGVYSNMDCGELDTAKSHKRWQATDSGLHALWSVNVAGATGTSMTAQVLRGIYTGTTHDDDFFSIDDGKTWQSAWGACGDCDTWFGDLYRPQQVLRIDPRGNDNKGTFSIFENATSRPPDATSKPASYNYPEGARSLTIGSEVIGGARYAIQSLPGESPPDKGDYLVIVDDSGTRKLMRAHDSLDASDTDSGFLQVGPDLPAGVRVVQASGGHANPTYYLGDGNSIWRGDKDNSGSLQWKPIVSGTPADHARRFFVDPWRPKVLYLIDDSAVRRSGNSGDTWQIDQALSDAVSGAGEWNFACTDIFCLLNDMAFDPTSSTRRFAAGVAGVFYTAGGVHWTRLLDTRSIPSRPLSLWFDPLTNPVADALVVGTMGRGVLRLSPVPDTDPVRPMEMLALPKHKLWKKWLPVPDQMKPVTRIQPPTDRRAPDKASPREIVRQRMLVLDDRRGMTSGMKQLNVPCDTAEYRITFNWVAKHNRIREVPDAVDLYMTDRDGFKELAMTLGAQLSNGSWETERLYLAPGLCGPVTVDFSSRFGEDRHVSFSIRDLHLERASE